MTRLFITGDTHGELSMKKLSNKNWSTGRDLTKDDVVIIAGDFGLLFDPVQSPAEEYWLKWLESKQWTTCFVDGNHENFDLLEHLPVVDKFNGKVGKVSDSVYHLRRGEVYTIADKKILTFGGAESIDKANRKEFITWWRQEIPSYQEFDKAAESIQKNPEVDLIISHTCPTDIANQLLAILGNNYKNINDPTSKMLDTIISSVKFQDHYFGHWHIDRDIGKHHALYYRIIEVL